MNSGNAKFSVVIEIEANVSAMTNEEVIEFMLERLAGMTIGSIDGTEERDWDCVFSNVELAKEQE